MKIIIVGAGKVGKVLAKELCKEHHDITVIDNDADALDNVTSNVDVLGIVGNGASYSVQMEAGIAETDILIAVTESDELNLLCCLFAKKAGVGNTIARVRNRQYREEIGYIKEELGLSMAINPELAAAEEMARILRFPLAKKIETFAKGKVELCKFEIANESVLTGKSLIDISNMTQSEVLICAVERGEDVIIPNGRFVLASGDVISILASPKAAKNFFKKTKYDTHQVDNTLIIGGGRLAYYLASMLCDNGIAVKIIEKDRTRCEELAEILPNCTIINGDSSNQNVLIEEGIEKADSFVALTGMDETNIFLSMFAKKWSKSKIITKINRPDFGNFIPSFNLDSIICPKNITADRILSYVRAKENSLGSNIETIYKIIDDKAEALEFKVNGDGGYLNKPLMELKLKNNLLVGCVIRNGKAHIANGQTTLQSGDSVVVITTLTGLNDLKDIFEAK